MEAEKRRAKRALHANPGLPLLPTRCLRPVGQSRLEAGRSAPCGRRFLRHIVSVLFVLFAPEKTRWIVCGIEPMSAMLK